jgi:hypothetical protein
MAKVKNLVRRYVKKILPGNDPNFLIVGAQKAGTTSLHFYLSQHPKIVGSTPKEVRFFDRDDRYRLGRNWYRKAFIDVKRPFGAYKYFEATPEYLYRLDAAERIYKFNPDIKIIILLREPVKRAYSAWNMYRDFLDSGKPLPSVFNNGYIHDTENNIMKELYQSGIFPTFEQAVRADIAKYKTSSPLQEPSFIRRGVYYPQVKKYLDVFGAENVKIIAFNDLLNERKIETLNEILSFIELPPSEWKFLLDEKKNVRSYPGKIEQDLEIELHEFYRPHNEKLFELLNKNLNW